MAYCYHYALKGQWVNKIVIKSNPRSKRNFEFLIEEPLGLGIYLNKEKLITKSNDDDSVWKSFHIKYLCYGIKCHINSIRSQVTMVFLSDK